MRDTNPAELERIRSVTANYFFWQGLRWVPLGLVIMIFGLKYTPWWPLAGAWDDVFIFALVAIVTVSSLLIGRYYRRTFGQVRHDPDAHQRREAMKWFLVYPLMVASLVIDIVFKPAFFVTGLVWSAGILAYWNSTGRGRPHYLVASVGMLALSFIPWLGFVEPGKQMFSVFAVVLGATYIIGGMLDHRELCRILRPLKESQDGTAV
jgi:hypothetical protein